MTGGDSWLRVWLWNGGGERWKVALTPRLWHSGDAIQQEATFERQRLAGLEWQHTPGGERGRHQKAGWEVQRHAHSRGTETAVAYNWRAQTFPQCPLGAARSIQLVRLARDSWGVGIFIRRRWEWCMGKYQKVGGLITSLKINKPSKKAFGIGIQFVSQLPGLAAASEPGTSEPFCF